MVVAMIVLTAALLYALALILTIALCRAGHHEDVRRRYVED